MIADAALGVELRLIREGRKMEIVVNRETRHFA